MWYKVRRTHKRGLPEAITNLLDHSLIDAARSRMENAPERPDLIIKYKAAKMAVLSGSRLPCIEALCPKARRFAASLGVVTRFQNGDALTASDMSPEQWAIGVVLKGSFNIESNQVEGGVARLEPGDSGSRHPSAATVRCAAGDWFGCLEPKSAGEGSIELEGSAGRSAATVSSEGGAAVAL